MIAGFIFKFLNKTRVTQEDILKSEEKYYKRKYFLSIAEQSFYLTLKHILSDEYAVFANTRMIDVIGANQKGKPRVMQKHIDFVITRKNQPVLAIELDDSSHNNQSRQKQDAVKNAIFEAANFSYLRVPAKRSYNTTELKNLLDSRLQ